VLERRDVDAQDPNGQPPVLGCRRWRRGARPRSRRRTGCARASKPGSPATAARIWWHGSAGYRCSGTGRGSSPPRLGPDAHPAQGVDLPARQAQLRVVRETRHGGCPLGRQARSARDVSTRPARVGGRHGQKAAQDPRGLPALPRRHSCNSCHARGVLAEELSALKGARWGSEGGCAEKAGPRNR